MRNTTFYSQAKNSVVVSAADGTWSRVIKDYYEGDDAISWEPNAERVAVTEGLDKSALSLSSGRAGKITIKLKPTSPDCGALTRLYNMRLTTPQLVNVSIVTGVDEQHSLGNAFVNVSGGSTGGTTMQARDFVFTGEDLRLDESEGV